MPSKSKKPVGNADKRKKVNKKSNVNNHEEIIDNRFDITGIILISIGFLLFFALISRLFSNPSSVIGSIGVILNTLSIGLIGIGAYALPFFFMVTGFYYIKTSGRLRINRRFYGIIGFIIGLLIFVECIVLPNYYIKGRLGAAVIAQFTTENSFHGGILSLLVSVLLCNFFGKVGAYIICITVMLICTIVISQLKIKDVVDLGRNTIKNNRKLKKQEVQKVNDIEVPQVEENSLDSKREESRIKIIDFMKDLKEETPLDKENNEMKINTYEDKVSTKKDSNIEAEDYSIDIDVEDMRELREYKYPAIDLLNKNDMSNLKKGDKKELLNSAGKLQDTLLSFGVEAKVIQVTKGPSVTRFELQPHSGVKVSKIVNLADDIALNLAASGVRIEAPIPGKAAVGIEVPNKDLSPVYLREVVEDDEFQNTNKNIAFCLGKDIGGNAIVADLSKMPHMLVAGATGSGKSVCINTLLISILYKYSPEKVRLLLVDPKVVELSIYNGIPHLLIPVVTDPKKAAGALSWAVNEMTRRYNLFADNNVRNIEGYNDLFGKGIISEELPWIVIVIDELADLMMVCANEVEDSIGRLAQMARAAGMHLVIATQRPSVDVITGVIKANIPSRISFAVSSQIDSRTILDSAGAEKLLGKGDMLFYPVGESKPIRIQGAFVSEEEVERVVEFVKQDIETTDYKKEIIEQLESSSSSKENDDDDDELLNDAIRIVIDAGGASTSLLQRRLKIGYNRAARIIDIMESRGIVSGKNGSKPRQILIKDTDSNTNA